MDRDRAERRWRRRTPRGNFLWLRSWRLTHDRADAGPIESHRVLIHPDRDGDYYDSGVLPAEQRLLAGVEGAPREGKPRRPPSPTCACTAVRLIMAKSALMPPGAGHRVVHPSTVPLL
jgi:hypothetical protein